MWVMVIIDYMGLQASSSSESGPTTGLTRLQTEVLNIECLAGLRILFDRFFRLT